MLHCFSALLLITEGNGTEQKRSLWDQVSVSWAVGRAEPTLSEASQR